MQRVSMSAITLWGFSVFLHYRECSDNMCIPYHSISEDVGIQHNEAEANSPGFSMKIVNFIDHCLINKIMFLRQTGNKPSLEPMMDYFADTYMRHWD